MQKRKRIVIAVMSAILIFALSACGGIKQAAIMSEKDQSQETEVLKQSIASENDREEGIKTDYELNKSKSFIVGKVVYHSYPDGWGNKGNYAEGFPEEGIKTIQLRLDADKYYNYERLWNTAEADKDASYCYFRLGQFNWNGGKYREMMNSSGAGQVSFNGLVTDEYLDELKRNGQRIEFILDIDREYQHMAEEGDIVILASDAQLTYNGNYFTEGGAERISFPKWYSAVVAPFAPDHPEPYIAKFVDGKLQLSDNMKDAFALKRLYPDTDPQLTGIKDGDSVEDVVNFLKAVQQDMARYEAELRQLPASTDVSSIR